MSKFRREWMVTGGEGKGIRRNLMPTAMISISAIRLQKVFQTGVWSMIATMASVIVDRKQKL